MAKLTQSNKHLKDPAKRAEILEKSTVQSNAIEGIKTTKKSVRSDEVKRTLKRAG